MQSYTSAFGCVFCMSELISCQQMFMNILRNGFCLNIGNLPLAYFIDKGKNMIWTQWTLHT